MALSNYTELKATIADWLNRADLTAQIPDFIRLGEATMRRRLRCRRAMTSSVLLINAPRAPLPPNYAGVRSLTLTDAGRPLDYVTPERLAQIKLANGLVTSRPRAYTIMGDQIEFAPEPDQAYLSDLVYFESVPPLSDGIVSNWVLEDHPDLYLYASLAAASAFLKDDDRVPLWQAAADTILDSIDESNEAEVQSGQPLKMQIRPFGRRYSHRA